MSDYVGMRLVEQAKRIAELEQQLAALRKGIKKLATLDAAIASTLDLELEMKLEAEFAIVLMGLAALPEEGK